MDNVVYILGAGFSAPLGMPVTSTFMQAAQDMRRSGLAKFEYFDGIFSMAHDFAAVKNYLASDLLNIEEILSILEMRSDLQGESASELFIQFIRDVINHHMPTWVPAERPVAADWHDQMWGSGDGLAPYREFVGSLFGLSLVRPADADPMVDGFGHCGARYSVVTFNYDRVLETLCANASGFLGGESAVAFRTGRHVVEEPFTEVPALIKLHGDSQVGDLVPPTWSKGATEKVLPAWKEAFAVLQAATKIRFLGYSLPFGDSYFRYLMKATLVDGRYLKEVDVVCLDPDQTVRARYENFVVFPNMRFASENVMEYLYMVAKAKQMGKVALPGNVRRPYQWLEDAHQRFFGPRVGRL